MRCQLLAILLLLAPSEVWGQSLPTNQKVWDTIPGPANDHARRIARFEAEPVVEGRVIFFGNSITEGGDWRALTGDSTVINRGIGGDLTFGLKHRLGDVIRRKPSKLFILIGINDISRDIPDAVIAAQYRDIIDSVHARSPKTRVFVQSILPLNNTVRNFPQHYDKQSHVIAVNRLLRQVARVTGAHYVDLVPLIADARGRLDARYTYDGLHLNAAGYARWARYLKSAGLI